MALLRQSIHMIEWYSGVGVRIKLILKEIEEACIVNITLDVSLLCAIVFI